MKLRFISLFYSYQLLDFWKDWDTPSSWVEYEELFIWANYSVNILFFLNPIVNLGAIVSRTALSKLWSFCLSRSYSFCCFLCSLCNLSIFLSFSMALALLSDCSAFLIMRLELISSIFRFLISFFFMTSKFICSLTYSSCLFC